jgi:hypothetical protein
MTRMAVDQTVGIAGAMTTNRTIDMAIARAVGTRHRSSGRWRVLCSTP